MKILIIPDVHGRSFWKEPCKHIDEFDKVVFLGDYVDHYPQEGDLDDLQTLKDVIEFAKSNRDKIKLLLGNHDYHYINDNYTKLARSSRYDITEAEEYNKLYKDNLDLFKFVYDFDSKIIFSHAGINQSWWNKLNIEHPLYINHMNDLWLAKYLSYISFYRWGSNDCGSCLWSDLREMVPDNLPKSIPFQVFGHTQVRQPIVTPKWACLDCREAFYIDDDLKIHPWNHSDKTIKETDYKTLYHLA